MPTVDPPADFCVLRRYIKSDIFYRGGSRHHPMYLQPRLERSARVTVRPSVMYVRPFYLPACSYILSVLFHSRVLSPFVLRNWGVGMRAMMSDDLIRPPVM